MQDIRGLTGLIIGSVAGEVGVYKPLVLDTVVNAFHFRIQKILSLHTYILHFNV